MKKILENCPFFLILLPAFITLRFEKEFHGIIKYEFIYDRMLILFLIPLFLFLIFYFIFRSTSKASLMTVGCLFFLYFAGDIKNKLVEMSPSSFWQSYSFIIPLIIVLLILLFIILKKRDGRFSRTYIFFNVLLFLFVAIEVFGILNKPPNKYKIASDFELTPQRDSIVFPDIYYIILDAYTSGNMLSSQMDYSNASLEEFLLNKGFRIATDARSNYNYTAFSIASSLNLNYFENIDTINKITDRTYLQSLRFVHDNRVISFLKENKYQIFNHSLFDLKEHPTTVKGIDFWNIRNLFDQYNLLFKMSREMGYHLPEKIQSVFHNYEYDINKPPGRKIHSSLAFDHAVTSAKLITVHPKFVFAHFLEPHPPFCFDSVGNLFPESPDNKTGYINQIVYVNKMIKVIIDTILANSQRPPVIILCGDHGISFKNPPDSKEAFSNFYAVYFPDKNYSLFSDSTHNVNTFRIILNTYFKQEFPLLEYRSAFLKE